MSFVEADRVKPDVCVHRKKGPEWGARFFVRKFFSDDVFVKSYFDVYWPVDVQVNYALLNLLEHISSIFDILILLVAQFHNFENQGPWV